MVSFPLERYTVRVAPYGVCHHLCELVETELAVSVLVGFHNSLVHDLLQLRVLPNQIISPRHSHGILRERTFRLLPTIIFNTKNNSPLEIYPSRSMS